MMALVEGLRIKVNRDLSMLGANVFRVDKWLEASRSAAIASTGSASPSGPR